MKMPQLCACGKQFSIVVVISEINFCCSVTLSVFDDVVAGSTTRRISPPV
jgi:hypothetical protein